MESKYTVVLAGLVLAGCGGGHPAGKKAGESAPAVAVQVVEVSRAEWPSVYEASGTVRARTAAAISSKVMSYVREVKVQVGDRVSAGQLLVEIDARDLDTQVRQAEAAHREAEEALHEAESAIASARANLELAQATFRRMEDLFQKKSISNQEYDEASARLKAAQAAHEMAAAKRRQVAAKVKQAAEGIQAAAILRSYAEIKAPFPGVVTEKRVEPGNLAAPGAPLLTIEQTGALRLEVPVAESRLGTIRAGHPVSVALEALDRTVTARVSEVVPAVDAASRAFTVKIDLPALPQLRSGLFGRAVFPTGSRPVLAAPRGAVIEQGQVQTVLVAAEGVAHSRLVTLGEVRGEQVELLSGVNPGEKIVFPRPAGLSDGARVEVRP